MSRELVYFLQRQSDGAVKVGMTTNLVARYVNLRAMYGPLRLVAYMSPWAGQSLRETEQIAHAFLGYWNLGLTGYGNTEWFSADMFEGSSWHLIAKVCPTIHVLDSRLVVQRDLVEMAQCPLRHPATLDGITV